MGYSEKFKIALSCSSRLRLRPNDLRRIWKGIKGYLDSVDDELIFALISEMANEGTLRFSSHSPKDREHLVNASRGLWFPDFVTIIRKSKEQKRSWEQEGYHWHSALHFWRDLNGKDKNLLVLINQWLFSKGERLQVPLNERSLEITGDEKRLARLEKGGALFGGKLPLEKIAAYVPAIPLEPAYFGNEGPALIVENRDTWWSLCEWNKKIQKYQVIIYGAGNGLANLDINRALDKMSVHQIEYYGDLDLPGLKIPLAFAKKYKDRYAFGPAGKLYDQLLETDIILSKKQGTINREVANLGKSWFTDNWRNVRDMIEQGHWIPQEALGLEKLLEA